MNSSFNSNLPILSNEGGLSAYLDQITEPLLMQSYATLFFVSFILCVVIILSSGYGFSRRGVFDEVAIQSAHSGFVPRVGGLAIYICPASTKGLKCFKNNAANNVAI